MGKGDKKYKRKRAGRKRKVDALRLPSGKIYYKDEAVRSKPTPEMDAKREALLGGLNGCTDCPIDVCEAQAWLTAEQANAARKLRALHRRMQTAIDGPKAGGSPLQQFLPAGAAPPPLDEDGFDKLKNALDDALWAMKCAGSREADAVEKFVSSSALPLPRELERIRAGLEGLVEHFGLKN